MKTYDFVIAGGGLAGLSLACRLVAGPLRDRSILIVDRDAKTRNDRTWCFWSDRPTPFDAIVHRTWDRLRVAGPGDDRICRLERYRYHMIRGLDFYRAAHARLAESGRVEFLHGTVTGIRDGAEAAVVTVNGQDYGARWAFDSRFRLADLRPVPADYHLLQQHFSGWFVETPGDAFDPSAATLFDFRVPQHGELRFVYVLPLTARRALVECVQLSPDRGDRALRGYVEDVLGLRAYRVVARERGASPLTDYPFPRRLGPRTMAIATRGGQIKPSSGYAFTRIQQDSDAIVAALLRTGEPFAVPASPVRYRVFDALLLELMQDRGAELAPLFRTMFANNPADRVLRFLDERASAGENLRFIATLPPRRFVQMLLRPRWLNSLRRSDPWPIVPPLW